MLEYLTQDGDMMDSIAWRQYGSTNGRIVEQLFEANPGIADMGPVLPAGVLVKLPEITPAADKEMVRLWT